MKKYDEALNDMINQVNMGYDHLLTYFKTLKNTYINRFLGIINSIESSFEDRL